jgi:hypothetical protein
VCVCVCIVAGFDVTRGFCVRRGKEMLPEGV